MLEQSRNTMSYVKILGETYFQPWEVPRSGSKAKDGKERLNDGNNNGQLSIAIATTGGARKAAWANFSGIAKLSSSWQLQLQLN